MTRGGEGDAAISTSNAVLSCDAASSSSPLPSPSHVRFLFLPQDVRVLVFIAASFRIFGSMDLVFGVLLSWFPCCNFFL
jgi:hypothetical protein